MTPTRSSVPVTAAYAAREPNANPTRTTLAMACSTTITIMNKQLSLATYTTLASTSECGLGSMPVSPLGILFYSVLLWDLLWSNKAGEASTML